MHLDRAAAFLFFEKDHPVQDLIHRMKYADQPMIGYQLGREAAMEFQCADFFDEIDIIVPIPLHPKRLRERGYNQSEYIARGISDVTGIPVDTTHVERIRNTPKQALQSGDERKQNVADAFAVNHPEQLYHKHILLVDDLITTGETARSCLRAMRLFRGATVSVFALCKAR
jgi:ComF family protein